MFGMRLAVALLSFYLGVMVVGASTNTRFEDFAVRFNKKYNSLEETEYRRAVFESNYQELVQHNKRYEAGKVSWFQQVTEFMDLTHAEFLQTRTGGIEIPADVPSNHGSTPLMDRVMNPSIKAKLASQKEAPPAEFSWIPLGGVSGVKNQGRCGSCAAFAALGSIESCYIINGGDIHLDLSEQHLLDCAYGHVASDDYGNHDAHGCKGATPIAYLDYIRGNFNQHETVYPYTSGTSGEVTTCSPVQDGWYEDMYVTGYENLWYPNENDMDALVMINPVATSVFATDNWHSYGGGVLDDDLCCDAATDGPDCLKNHNHSVLVVGWGTENGKDYWLIKNSWGTRWGENGYLKLKRGTGHCVVGYYYQAMAAC